MSSFQRPGPILGSGDPQSLDDGTLARRLTPHPGPVGIDKPLSGVSVRAAEHESNVNWLLRQLRAASSGVELQRIIVALIGPQCFAAGTVAGIGMEVFEGARDLVKLAATFVLADLHDLASRRADWWRYVGPVTAPRLVTAKLAQTFLGEELKQAAEERDALIKELSVALQDPKAFFENMTDAIAEGLKKDWRDFDSHMGANTPEGRFRAGMIFGRLLVDVLALVTGTVGGAKIGAKLASKIPRLKKYADSLKINPRRLKPGAGGNRTSPSTNAENSRTLPNIANSENGSANSGNVRKAAMSEEPKEPIENTVKVEEGKTASDVNTRLAELANEGHGPQRHEGDVTDQQLRERALYGKDPMTGTTSDGVTGGVHKYGKHATKINSPDAYVKGENALKRSDEFTRKSVDATTNGENRVVVESMKLEDIYGPKYRDNVSGYTRQGSKNNPTGTTPTDFSGGNMVGVYEYDPATSGWKLVTMYPNPIN